MTSWYNFMNIVLVADVVECTVCQGATEAIEDMLNQNAAAFDLMRHLEKICNNLPPHYYQRCDTLVSVYGVSMVRQLKGHVEKEQVCVNMGLCGNTSGYVKLEDEIAKDDHVEKKHEHLVGAHECTWGPSHWCSSEEIAEMCKVSITVWYGYCSPD